MIRVLLADDHGLFREGLRALLHSTPDIRVVADVATGREAIAQLADQKPEIVIMDVVMPDLNGIEAARIIATRWPAIRIIMLSMHSSFEHVARSLGVGARGYLLKESASAEVVKAVRAVHNGGTYLCDLIRTKIPSSIASNHAFLAPIDRLSSREQQVFQLVVEGKTSAQIAELIHISPKSVETYRSRLMKKLGVADLVSLVKFAIEHGITPLQ